MKTWLELDRAACHMITSAQWQFGVFIKRRHCPLWLIEKVGGVTPHSGGRGCFIYTFFGVSLFTVATPPSQPKCPHKPCLLCASTRLAVQCFGGAFTFVRSFVTRHFTNHFQSHICVPNVPIVFLCAKAPNLRLYWKVRLQRKSCATHRRTCPPLPQHTHTKQRGERGWEWNYYYFWNRLQWFCCVQLDLQICAFYIYDDLKYNFGIECFF